MRLWRSWCARTSLYRSILRPIIGSRTAPPPRRIFSWPPTRWVSEPSGWACIPRKNGSTGSAGFAAFPIRWHPFPWCPSGIRPCGKRGSTGSSPPGSTGNDGVYREGPTPARATRLERKGPHGGGREDRSRRGRTRGVPYDRRHSASSGEAKGRENGRRHRCGGSVVVCRAGRPLPPVRRLPPVPRRRAGGTWRRAAAERAGVRRGLLRGALRGVRGGAGELPAFAPGGGIHPVGLFRLRRRDDLGSVRKGRRTGRCPWGGDLAPRGRPEGGLPSVRGRPLPGPRFRPGAGGSRRRRGPLVHVGDHGFPEGGDDLPPEYPLLRRLLPLHA